MCLSALAYIVQQLLPSNFGPDSVTWVLMAQRFVSFMNGAILSATAMRGRKKRISVLRLKLNKGKKCHSHAQLRGSFKFDMLPRGLFRICVLLFRHTV